jgi:3-oxoadipate enol-lactonase
MDDYNYLEAAKGLKVPSLLVCGAQDAPLDAMKELEKAVPGGRLVEIENCGHLPMIEQPQALIEIVEGYL